MSKRLGAVLRIRKLQERQARGELAQSRTTHRTAVIAERRTWVALDEHTRTGTTQPSTGGPDTVLGGRAVIDAGLLAAETQHGTTERAAEAVEVCMDHWTIAARRVEGLERLADRIEEAEREEYERKVANEMDDLVLAKFNRTPTGLPGPGHIGGNA